MQFKFLKPVEGRQVPDPERKYALMSAEGRRVQMTQYWQKRLDEKDVEEVAEVAVAAPAPATDKKGGAA